MKNRSLHILISMLFITLVLISCEQTTSQKKASPDPCKEVTCLNGGICDAGLCNCPDGFSGTDCSIEDKCITQNPTCKSYEKCEDGICILDKMTEEYLHGKWKVGSESFEFKPEGSFTEGLRGGYYKAQPDLNKIDFMATKDGKPYNTWTIDGQFTSDKFSVNKGMFSLKRVE